MHTEETELLSGEAAERRAIALPRPLTQGWTDRTDGREGPQARGRL